jgi:hypothetical protein
LNREFAIEFGKTDKLVIESGKGYLVLKVENPAAQAVIDALKKQRAVGQSETEELPDEYDLPEMQMTSAAVGAQAKFSFSVPEESVAKFQCGKRLKSGKFKAYAVGQKFPPVP